MPDAHHLLLFLAAGLVLNLTPGPDVMFIVANAVRAGVRAGVAAALGIAAGCLVHVAAAALGVSALLAASSTAFALLKWAGAVYLVWVGVQMLRAAWRAGGAQDTSKSIAASEDGTKASGVFDAKNPAVESAASATPAPPVALATVLRRGFLTNVLNPKVALFFLAFVPQFIAPGTAHTGAVFLLLGLLFTVNGLLVCLGWAWVAAWASRRAGALQRALRWLDGVAGGLFIVFGVKLALTQAPGAR
ncbi:LysE family translocator [Extensimonas sp. H3M7-6]|uniref:LysE family translocator n=1 Tax=Extensimonas soli TaxID=3031322 RepID=UPI0023DAED98|nr:LysE family translocator [Extensimonas sp. H3M7-6]MDF1480512.1 LysE family translocator [Extensimonas sp. H3M7-6]